ncbi:MAG: deoxyribodipyrimidine photo-lyase, partial [Duganella sp.]
MKLKSSLVWLRRDLRVFDHAALNQALQDSAVVHCVFVYDTTILDALPRRDRRVDFIHASLAELASELRQLGGDLIVLHDDAATAIPRLAAELQADAVFANHDYEPQAIARDAVVAEALTLDARLWFSFKDQVIFEKDEVLTLSDKPYTVYTPYKNAWLKKMRADPACL